MRIAYLLLAVLCIGSSICVAQSKQAAAAGTLMDRYLHPRPDEVMVVAHRGDWRNAPENSIHGLKLALKIGVDMVEIDVRKTKDGVLVLMHDETLNRTSSGKGKLKDWTWDSLQNLTLKQGHGGPTQERIPLFEAYMKEVKGKPVLVNLDKCWDIIPDVYAVLKSTGTIEQTVIKGTRSLGEMREMFGALLDSIHYTPMLSAAKYADRAAAQSSYLDSFLHHYNTAGIEVAFTTEDDPVLTQAIPRIRKKGLPVFACSLWPSMNAGHDDEKAMENPDANWGWLVRHGATTIQTDRPAELLAYLRSKGWHK